MTGKGDAICPHEFVDRPGSKYCGHWEKTVSADGYMTFSSQCGYPRNCHPVGADGNADHE